MYCDQLRKIAYRLWKQTWSLQKIAICIDVSKSTLQRWLTQGGIRKQTRKSKCKQDDTCTMNRLRYLIHTNPFASCRVYAYQLNVSGFNISHTTVFSLMKSALGLSFKKTKSLLPIKNLDILKDKRKMYRLKICFSEVISVDETSFYRKFSPKYAWSPKRNHLHVPQQKIQSKRSTLISI